MAKKKNKKKKTAKELESKKRDEEINRNTSNINNKNRSIIAVLIILVFIAFISLIILFRENQEGQINNVNKTNVSIIIKQSAGKTTTECLTGYGINESVIYIYGEDCVYSQKNTPWIAKMKTEYNIRMISTENTEQLIKFMNCMNSFELEGTPTYICLKNSQIHIGSFNSESELNLFLSQCR
ncbi:MAG: hypothetical protein QXW80_00830 [Candidatus Micrarchaeia archaeon]